MSIHHYVEQIAVADPTIRREVVLKILQNLGCSFTIQREEIKGHYPQNIILQFGRGSPRLVVGAHYDSVLGSTGANDNGSGVAILLDLARTLRIEPPLAPVDIVFFDLEEQEWLGSRSYVKCISPDDILAYINLDICGVGDTIVIAPRINVETGFLQKITAMPQDSPYSTRVMEWLPPGDETSFKQVGIPYVTVGVIPSDDIELLEASLVAIQQNEQPAEMPSVAETIHNGPRDSIDVIQETALHAARHWLDQLVELYISYTNDLQ